MSGRREVATEEWAKEIQRQPLSVARLLAYETRFGHLHVDDAGYVWSGGIGAGYGTAFKLGEADK